MTIRKFSFFLTLMLFFSVFILVKPVWADSAKAFTLQDSADFVKDKDSTIQNNQLVNQPTTIWAFITNKGEAQNVDAPSRVELTLTLIGPQGQNIVLPDKLVIESGQYSGSEDVIFPTAGLWQISASGTIINNNQTEISTFTTNVFTVKQAQSLTLQPNEATIPVGSTQQFSAILNFQDHTSQDISDRVNWSVSDPKIASINSNGLLTGISAGLTTVHAEDPKSGLSQVAQIIVEATESAGLEIVPKNSKIGVGGKQQFQANLYFYLYGSKINIDVTNLATWTSSNSAIADISSWNLSSWTGGLATGLSPGKSTITASIWPFSSAPATLEVEELTMIPQSQTIKVGDTQQFEVTLVHSDLTTQGVTESAQWTSTNSLVADMNSMKPGEARGLSVGTTTITASYNGLSASATLNVGASSLDHYGFVDSNGSPVDSKGLPIQPHLKLRGDTNVSDSTWAYMGEPMDIDVYLQAYSADGKPLENYVWDTNWFSVPVHWQVTSSGNGVDPSKLSTSVLRVETLESGGYPTLHAFLEVTQSDSSLSKAISDYRLTLNPRDSAGISAPAAQALVWGQPAGTTYKLYSGRIRVAQSYYYQVNGKAQVYVDYYNGTEFTPNLSDSQTSVSTWDLSGIPIAATVIFQEGSGEVPVSSEKSNVSLTLTPTAYPSYLEIVPGDLTWGQIVDNPPPPNSNHQDEGPVWEKELPP